jgi:hypothetical protein
MLARTIVLKLFVLEKTKSEIRWENACASLASVNTREARNALKKVALTPTLRETVKEFVFARQLIRNIPTVNSRSASRKLARILMLREIKLETANVPLDSSYMELIRLVCQRLVKIPTLRDKVMENADARRDSLRTRRPNVLSLIVRIKMLLET